MTNKSRLAADASYHFSTVSKKKKKKKNAFAMRVTREQRRKFVVGLIFFLSSLQPIQWIKITSRECALSSCLQFKDYYGARLSKRRG